MSVHACACTCLYTWDAHVDTCVDTDVYTHVCTYVCTSVYTCVCTRVSTYFHTQFYPCDQDLGMLRPMSSSHTFAQPGGTRFMLSELDRASIASEMLSAPSSPSFSSSSDLCAPLYTCPQMSICMCMHMSVHVCILMPAHVSTHMSMHMSVRMNVSTAVHTIARR